MTDPIMRKSHRHDSKPEQDLCPVCKGMDETCKNCYGEGVIYK